MNDDAESASNSPANITPNISNPGTPRSDAGLEMRGTPPPAPVQIQRPVASVNQQQQQQQLLLQHQQQLQQMQSQSKYTQLLAVIEDLGRDIRPTYAGSRTSAERLKRGIVHARILVRECLTECERSARS
ncbi:cyclin-dependent kinase 2-associated protein 1-like [Mya arenaria]|uniref:cyclin-dependent kinase 2-associated protein 1-like n=1 Tax=Mya arenaria TaxID=6604 RepID=UPI0022E8CF10|nr:cyclin-dependent kinase 2-associated protein 1-like [Mya arenaria]XP_052779428.1 cyclin-dependent kinase 2-associated protein 1-like [Mya arenaria]